VQASEEAAKLMYELAMVKEVAKFGENASKVKVRLVLNITVYYK